MRKRGDRIDYVLRKGCEDMRDNDSRNTYKRACTAFSRFLCNQGIKYTGQIEKAYTGQIEAVQAFLTGMVNGTVAKKDGTHYSAATMSTYTKGVCHALGLDYKKVNADHICPKRTADRIQKGTGRRDGANPQGRAEAENPKYEHFLLLASVTGARRDELANIRGRDLVKDESGHLCIRIERGKGGKEQLQVIMPWEEKTVLQLFQGKKPKDYVLDKAEIRNKIDVHHIRAVRAQRCYEFFVSEIESGGADRLRDELIKRWDASHIKGREGQDRTARLEFVKEVSKNTPYKLRGASKNLAAENGRPLEYNRLALMAVSVFSLSHWRLDVTAVNYMIRK